MNDAEKSIHILLEELGLDPDNDQHLKGTPKRYSKWLHEFLDFEPFNFTTFEDKTQDMITVRDIPFYSLCAHHMLPFFGKAHVAYVPDGKLCGLSKLARAVDQCTHALGVQETLTSHIADLIEIELEPLGVGVILEGEHLCMTMRGIRKPGALTTTSSMRGVFLDVTKGAREEFLALTVGRR